MRTSPRVRTLLFIGSLGLAAGPARAQIASDGPMLEAFGGTLGIMLYNTYLAIGSVGDGFEHEAYDATTVGVLMDEQMNSMSTVGAQIEKLDDTLVLEDESDRAFVRDALLTMKDLSTMAGNMKAYATSLEASDADAFQTARTTAWGRLVTLLGIEEDQE